VGHKLRWSLLSHLSLVIYVPCMEISQSVAYATIWSLAGAGSVARR
jgi:hypothetical protein